MGLLGRTIPANLRQIIEVTEVGQLLEQIAQGGGRFVRQVSGQPVSRVHRSSSMACRRISSGRWLSALGTAKRMALRRIFPAWRGGPLEACRSSSFPESAIRVCGQHCDHSAHGTRATRSRNGGTALAGTPLAYWPGLLNAVAGSEWQIQSGTRDSPPVFVKRFRTSNDRKGVPALPMPCLSHAP